jgi:hypothetical protein
VLIFWNSKLILDRVHCSQIRVVKLVLDSPLSPVQFVSLSLGEGNHVLWCTGELNLSWSLG